jgi:hypothetical protein
VSSRVAYPGTAVTNDVLTAANVNNLPGGEIGHAELVADSSTFSSVLTDISGLSQTVTVNTNRKIRITFDASVNTSATDACFFFIREGSTQLRAITHVWGPNSTSSYIHFSVVISPSSGSHTYKISGQANTGTTNVKILASATNPAQMTIDDIGPSF